ncbi:MAG: hypothetical protein AAGI69_03240 [Cyanobacteria bacterium P01_H01_bin.21]
MDKLIQPLSDVLKQYPELSAKVIVIISTIFTSIATAYIFLQEQAKKALKDRLEGYKDTKEDLSGSLEKIRQLNKLKLDLETNLEKSKREIEKLKVENLDLETQQKLSDLQGKLFQMVVSTQNDIKNLDRAIATQDDRMRVFRASRKRQRKNIFASLFERR